ncbi:uncharacterized protein B0I36DRAFT_366623 [Microdochium trichocladiopsis]|uniref:Uncharacterized protein n=1 Tax=Microdochium trichocladiopsis TaxID=1682393 RepID=A0A9P9BL98_9PEZI|nr:uncharacterized protein B0I36DRAFT_366623 [Microdochium trichocladiopsis]KAH7024702.1 hypothetical protein B0I36DRAFT_366623 [Microdochium trichocladiopsis]
MGPETVEWAPNEEDGPLKAAFQSVCVTSLDKVMPKAPDGKTNRFILQTQGYQDIYAYVTEGKTLEASREKFEADLPEKALEKVTAVDPDAYDHLRNTTNNVAAHTREFSENGLDRLVLSANNAIVYADECINMLHEDKDLSLWKHLDVILEPKYSVEGAVLDDGFHDARDMARAAVQSMSETAQKMADDATQMVALLGDFHRTTSTDATAVSLIKRNWLDGSDGKRPYTEIVGAEIARLHQAIIDDTARRDAAKDEWDTNDTSAKIIGFLGCFIPSMPVTNAIVNEMGAEINYQRLTNLVASEQEAEKAIMKAHELVRALVMHFKDLVAKMAAALNAMTELQDLFKAQGANFKAIDTALGKLGQGVRSDYAMMRKLYIKAGIRDALEKLKQIKELAQEFQRGARPEFLTADKILKA